MNPLVSIIIILSVIVGGQCENQKRAVYVQNAGVNSGVVFTSGLSAHDSFGHVDVASSHHGLALTPSRGSSNAYSTGLTYGPAYGYGSSFGGHAGHYGLEGVHHVGGLGGPGVIHTTGGVEHGVVSTAHGVNYGNSHGVAVPNQVLVTNGIAHHQNVQSHPVYPEQLTHTLTVPAGHQTVHVPVNQHYPVNVHQPSYHVPVAQNPVQVVVPHQTVASGHVLSSAVSLEHSPGHNPAGQASVYYTVPNGFTSGWTSQGQLHASAVSQGWVH